MTKVLYAGLDVSLEMTSICVVDSEGGMILETKAVSDPADIGEVLAGIDATLEWVDWFNNRAAGTHRKRPANRSGGKLLRSSRKIRHGRVA